MTQSKDGSGSHQSSAHSIKKSLKDLFRLTCIICSVNVIHKPVHELSANRAVVNPGLCSSATCRWCSRMPCKSIKIKLKQIRAFKLCAATSVKSKEQGHFIQNIHPSLFSNENIFCNTTAILLVISHRLIIDPCRVITVQSGFTDYMEN